MHKNIPVVEVEIDDTSGTMLKVGTVYDHTHAPFISIKKGQISDGILRLWWNGRSIPASRDGLKDLLEKVGLSGPQPLLKHSYGLSLSDQYWICPKNAQIKWSDINFFDNEFSADVGNLLFGNAPNEINPNKLNLKSPDNTSDGVLKKKWKIINGKRYLIKAGNSLNTQEVFNEVIASKICDRLEIKHVPYDIYKENDSFFCACPNFITTNTDLVSAWQIRESEKKSNSTSDYEHYVSLAENLGVSNARLQVGKMLTLDYIIGNNDRHYNNFGLIRNAETLEWLSCSPIFDCGNSLCCTEAIITYAKLNESKPFRSTHSEQIKLVEDFSWLDFKKLDGIEDEFKETLSTVDKAYISEERKSRLCETLRSRITALEAYVENFSLKNRFQKKTTNDNINELEFE
jgi:hypothetical protein